MTEEDRRFGQPHYGHGPDVLTMWTIYQDPSDAPSGYRFMVRGFDSVGGKSVARHSAVAALTLELARAWIATNTSAVVRFPRSVDDDPVIVESWL